MAVAANKDSVNERDKVSNIDWGEALEIIQSTVHGIESDQRSLSQSAQEAWGRIEELGVNKEGAKKFSAMLKKPVEKRRDEFRSFINLAKAAGWFDWLDDLVDRSQTGPVVAAAPAAPKANVPAEHREPAVYHPKDDSDLAAGPTPERVNLKTGWVQRMKAGVVRGKNEMSTDDDWEDIRQATPKEMATERDRLADFDTDEGRAPGGPKPEPELEAAKAGARQKVGARRKK